jgi:hypothetical protein
MTLLDALFDPRAILPFSKHTSTSVTTTLKVGGGMVPFPKVHLGEKIREVQITLLLYQAIQITDGPYFSGGMVVRVPAASNVGEEQLFAIVGFAKVAGPRSNDTSKKAWFIRSKVQGHYVFMAKVRCFCFVSASLIFASVVCRFQAVQAEGSATASLS